jgi:hypothetical protein
MRFLAKFYRERIFALSASCRRANPRRSRTPIVRDTTNTPRRFGWSAHRGRRRAPSSPGRPCFDRGAPSPLGNVDGKGQTDLAGRTPSLNSPLRSRKPAASRPPDLGQSRSSERHALTARPGGSCSKKTIRGGDHSKKMHPIERLLMRLDQSPTNIQITIRSSSIGS